MKLKDLKNLIKKPYFDRLDLDFLEEKVYNYQISLWKKNEEIVRLKRGLYVFSDQKKDLSSKEVAFLIYQPSYISLEYALSYYKIIPEAVFAITSVSTKATRKFSNDFGVFLYSKIKANLFFGYKSYQIENGKYLLATPEKALLDYLYLNLGKIENEDDIEEIRINYEELGKLITKKRFRECLKEFKIKKLNKIANIILQKC